tara:strand:+ start:6086 stop:6466 length:381 start_codon:yes stop_codon:yes gene_type:complete
MGFCKPGDPCFNAVPGGINTARILEIRQQALNTAAYCGIDIPGFGDFCSQVRECVTGNTHTTLTACTMFVDVISPCSTGTTFTGMVRASSKMGVGTNTIPNKELTVVGSVSATSKLYFSEIEGGTF